jgi:hypothetical protein
MIVWEREGKTDAQEIAWMMISILAMIVVVLKIVVKTAAWEATRQ